MPSLLPEKFLCHVRLKRTYVLGAFYCDPWKAVCILVSVEIRGLAPSSTPMKASRTEVPSAVTREALRKLGQWLDDTDT